VEKDIVAKVGKLESQAWQLHLSFEAAAHKAVAADGATPRRLTATRSADSG
jgi:hypothetical protein